MKNKSKPELTLTWRYPMPKISGRQMRESINDPQKETRCAQPLQRRCLGLLGLVSFTSTPPNVSNVPTCDHKTSP